MPADTKLIIKSDSVSHLILAVCLDAALPLFSQQLLEDVVTLLLLLIVFLMALGVMDVMVVEPVLLLAVLVASAPESK